MAGRFVTLAVVIAASFGVLAQSAGAAPVVATHGGKLQGHTARGVERFLGVPYAAPPVGALRWRAPRPAADWQGVRKATAYGNRCPQLASGNGAASKREDCLYLNVFAPAHSARRGPLPVVFWIHGGGFVNGAGDQYDGSPLARGQDVVVVTVNYRLGALGFLALPSLSSEARDRTSGNYGLLDQLAALRWTRDNAAAFGGDPHRVTIAGESAGGMSVCSLLASPAARGLFGAAIIESGGCGSRTLKDAEAGGRAFAASVGCTRAATAAACLRRKPVKALLAVPDTGQSSPVGGSGATLPIPTAKAIASGRFNRVPVLNGANHDEGRTFAQGYFGLDQKGYEDEVALEYGPAAPALLAQYPYASYPQPYAAAYALGAMWTDSGALGGIGGCGTRSLSQLLAARTRTYAYEFNDPHAPGLNGDVPGYQWGSGHAMELAYLFPSFDNGTPLYAQLTRAQLRLSDQMVRYWGAFAWQHKPRVEGQPAWPRYRPSSRVLSLQPGGATHAISDEAYRADHKCSFWETLG